MLRYGFDDGKSLGITSGSICFESVITLSREIFRVLDLMKMDMVNFTIQSLRPDLQRQSVEYERAKFQSIVEKTPSESALLLTFNYYEEHFIGIGLAFGSFPCFFTNTFVS